jgi:hypothetical protein
MSRKMRVSALVVLAVSLLLSACGGKMGPEEAKAYAQSCLDASYKGELDEYVKQTESSKEEAQEMYDKGIEMTMESSGVTDAGVSQELQDKYEQLFIDLYKGAKYELGDAEEDGDDGFTIDVTVEPFTLFDGLDTALVEELEKATADMTEEPSAEEANELIYQSMYNLLSERVSNMEYGEQAVVTIHVKLDEEDKMYYIPDEDLEAVELALVPQA